MASSDLERGKRVMGEKEMLAFLWMTVSYALSLVFPKTDPPIVLELYRQMGALLDFPPCTTFLHVSGPDKGPPSNLHSRTLV